MSGITFREYLNKLKEVGLDKDILIALRKAYNEQYFQMLRYLEDNATTLPAFAQYRNILREVRDKLDELGAAAIEGNIQQYNEETSIRFLENSFDTLRTMTALFVNGRDEQVAHIARTIVRSGRLAK